MKPLPRQFVRAALIAPIGVAGIEDVIRRLAAPGGQGFRARQPQPAACRHRPASILTRPGGVRPASEANHGVYAANDLEYALDQGLSTSRQVKSCGAF
jgi:hypothetical protein